MAHGKPWHRDRDGAFRGNPYGKQDGTHHEPISDGDRLLPWFHENADKLFGCSRNACPAFRDAPTIAIQLRDHEPSMRIVRGEEQT